jgi:hypothetical protein
LPPEKVEGTLEKEKIREQPKNLIPTLPDFDAPE